MSQLRARRREARRRQRVARIDLGLGVFAALVLLLASPGLAITGLIVLAVLLVCAISLVHERRSRRAEAAPGPQPRAATRTARADTVARRGRKHAVRERTRSTR
jgi:multisubunit Na+/H+ antiporter MnhB subunit